MWVHFEKLDPMCSMRIVPEMNAEFFSLLFESLNAGNCLELGITFASFKSHPSEGLN